MNQQNYCNYMILQAVLRYLKEAGKSVPGDYSLVCMDYSKDDWEAVGVTCSISSGYEIGRQVGRRLMQMIKNKNYDDNGYSYLFEPKIYEGRSVGKNPS